MKYVNKIINREMSEKDEGEFLMTMCKIQLVIVELLNKRVGQEVTMTSSEKNLVYSSCCLDIVFINCPQLIMLGGY